MTEYSKSKTAFLYCFFYVFIPASIFLIISCENSERETFSDKSNNEIDRYALVTRHNPVLLQAEKLSPLSLGNGEFAFTADVTGLQTFPDFYSREENNIAPPGPDGFLTHSSLQGATPLATQRQWGWHSFPNSENYTLDDETSIYDAHGRRVPYVSGQHSPAGTWLRENPHRLNLARIGFDLKKQDGSRVELADLQNIRQELDLWSGTLTSEFEIEGTPVSVQSWVHPEYDLLSVKVDASALQEEQMGILVSFPYGRGLHAGDPSDWTKPDLHTTDVINSSGNHVEWHRILDNDEYFVHLSWTGTGEIVEQNKHVFLLRPSGATDSFSFSAAFSTSSL
jgi:protein-glucosylgalactosylhydroxylysine glucosidase